MTTTTIRDQVLSVIRNGNRIDRFIEAGADGELFVTTENTAETQIKIGCGFDTTESEEEEWADALIAQAEEELL